jgi:hypothetical protein
MILLPQLTTPCDWWAPWVLPAISVAALTLGDVVWVLREAWKRRRSG